MHDPTPSHDPESAETENAESEPPTSSTESQEDFGTGVPSPDLDTEREAGTPAAEHAIFAPEGEREPNGADAAMNEERGSIATAGTEGEIEPIMSASDFDGESEASPSTVDSRVADVAIAPDATPAMEGETLAAVAAFETEVRLLDERIGSRTPISFRDTWSRIHDLQGRVRSAPALIADDASRLQGDLRGIAVALRERQKSARKQASAVRTSIRESIDLAREGVEAAQNIADLQEARADLLLIKERLAADGHVLDRATRQALWEALQQANQTAWEGVTAAWDDNRQALGAMLQQAAASLEARDARAAREHIKAFHAALDELECNRRAQHEMQATAHRLWQQSTELTREKRAAYLIHAARRAEDWKRALRRQDAARGELQADIGTLEQQAATASTDVAAALVRGQLNERRKALRDLEVASEQLRRRIDEAQPRTRQPADAELEPAPHEPAVTE